MCEYVCVSVYVIFLGMMQAQKFVDYAKYIEMAKKVCVYVCMYVCMFKCVFVLHKLCRPCQAHRHGKQGVYANVCMRICPAQIL